MKNIVFIIAVLFSISLTAQKKEKIKGDGEVVEVFVDLDAFSQIEIADDLEVSIMQSNREGYRLKTDSNLVDVIEFEVVNDVLRIYTSSRIVSSKKLEIYVTFQYLNKIILNGKSELNGENNLELVNLSIISFDDAEFDLDIKANEVIIEMNNSSDGKLILKTEKSTMTLNDNAYLKGSLAIDDFSLNVNKRADMNLEGSSDNLILTTTGSSEIKGRKLKVTNAQLNASNNSDIYLNVSKNLSIYAKGRSNIYVYGSPEIKVEGLNDKSQIIKR